MTGTTSWRRFIQGEESEKTGRDLFAVVVPRVDGCAGIRAGRRREAARARGHRHRACRGLLHGAGSSFLRAGAGEGCRRGLRRNCSQSGRCGCHSNGHDSRLGVYRDPGAVYARDSLRQSRLLPPGLFFCGVFLFGSAARTAGKRQRSTRESAAALARPRTRAGKMPR